MKFNEAQVGMKVRPVFAEMTVAQRQNFNEEKDYVIEGFLDDVLIRVRDDEGRLRALRPQRFRPARIKVDGVFEVGDKVWYKLHVERGDDKRILKQYEVVEIINNRRIRLKGLVDYHVDLWMHVDLPPEPKKAPPPKPEPVWPELDEELMDELTKCSRGGVCNFALKNTDGVKVYKPVAACHYQLSGGAITGKVHTLACNVSSHYEKLNQVTKPLYVLHTEYILKESPWAKYFHERDMEKVLAGGVFMDVSHPHNHVVTACIALRMGHEHSPASKLPVFKRIIELGYNKHIAFIVAHTTTRSENDTVIPWNNGGWHHCISSDRNTEELCKFFKNGYSKGMDQKPTKDGLRAYVIQDTVASATGTSLSATYKTAKGMEIKKNQWGEDVEVPVQGFDESLKSLCDTLVPYFK